MQATLAMQIREKTQQWGADLVGFAPVERFQRYMLDNRPTVSLPIAQSVVVLGLQMIDPLLDLWLHGPASTGAGRYATGRAFEDEILRAICYRLVLLLLKQGIEAKVLPYGPETEEEQKGFIYLKEAGVLAGLGVIGKNNLLLNPTYGPRIRLRAVAVAELLPPSRVLTENPWCEKCDRCIRACPVNALDGKKYDREKCLTSPLHRRQLSPATQLWCTRCSAVCPVGISVPSDDTLRIHPA